MNHAVCGNQVKNINGQGDHGKPFINTLTIQWNRKFLSFIKGKIWQKVFHSKNSQLFLESFNFFLSVKTFSNNVRQKERQRFKMYFFTF